MAKLDSRRNEFSRQCRKQEADRSALPKGCARLPFCTHLEGIHNVSRIAPGVQDQVASDIMGTVFRAGQSFADLQKALGLNPTASAAA